MTSPDLLTSLQSIWTDLHALEALYRTAKIVCYKPIGKQAEVHAADGAAVRLVLGSNRSGKTVFGVNESIAHSLGERPWLPRDHPNRIVKLADGAPIPVPNVGRIIAQNYQQAIMQTIWPKIQEWAPAGQYTVKKDQRGIPVRIEWKNGSVIHLMSNDQDDMAFEGTNGHWVWADEPIDYAKYTGLKRGLVDFSGHMWMTMTPLTQPWIHDILVSRANEADGSVKLFKFSIWDNLIENGGHLRREDVEEFLSDLREEELEARLHGNFLHLAGRVFKEWEPEPPFWVPARAIPDHWPRVCVIDPHPRKPIAVMWAAINQDDQVFVYRELFDNKFRTVKDVADEIRKLEGWKWVGSEDHGRWIRTDETESIATRIIDNSSRAHERVAGQSIWQRFAALGLPCQLAQKQNAEAGLDAIHQNLKVRREWEEPGLVIFNSCPTVKDNFLKYVWDSWATAKQRDLNDDKQSPRKTNDDFLDCIRYFYQSGLTYQKLKRAARDQGSFEERDEELTGGCDIMTGVHPGLRRGERQNKKKGLRWPMC